MEAIDTVMSEREIEQIYAQGDFYHHYQDFGKEVANKQAEITAPIFFKAGQEYAMSKEGHEAISYLEGYQEGEKQGRKEVVEWIENHGGSLDGCRKEWQAFKKKLGL